MDEIEYLYREHGVRTIKFNDDNIFGPGAAGCQRVVEMCQEILRRGIRVHLMAYCRVTDVEPEVMRLMRQAGFERLLIGVESADDGTLKRYRKGITGKEVKEALQILKDIGISVIPGFMMFDPYSTVDILTKNLEFLKEVRAYGVCLSKNLKVHDSAPIKQELEDEGRLRHVASLEGYHEYVVPEDVARVYHMNKLFWVYYIDPLNEEGRTAMLALKRTVSFNEREEWEEALRDLWTIQAEFLEQTLRWVRPPAPGVEEIRAWVEQVLTNLARVQRKRQILLSRGRAGVRPRYGLGIVRLSQGPLVMDLTTSRLIEVRDELLLRAVSVLIDGADLDLLEVILRGEVGPEKASKARRWAEENLAPAAYRERVRPGPEEFTAQLYSLLTGPIDPVLPERYVWSE